MSSLTPPFDDRDGFIWLDGQLVDWRSANIHVLTHALHYGSAVFEGERAYGGKIFKVEDHNARLVRSAAILDMEVPYDTQTLTDARYAVIKANGTPDCYLRPLVWRGSEVMGIAAQGTKIHVMIAAWVWASYYSPEKAAQGLRLCSTKWKRPSPDTAPIQAKASGGYMLGTIAKHAAMAAGYDDAIMLDYKDRVAEGTGANLFMIKGGVLYTPPTECSLNGITRLTTIDMARGMGYTVEEKFFGYDELVHADEVFLTGTAAELQAVGEIDDHKIGVGPITTAMKTAYAELVRK